MNFVVFINGAVVSVMGAVMLLVAVLFADTRTIFLESAFVAIPLGAMVCLTQVNRLFPVHRLHTFLLTATVWITGASVGALPLWLWQLTFTDAFFEAMSGITTTGSTVMAGLDTTAHGILLWRALLQWIGGVGFVVTGIAFLPMLRVGGMQLFRTESSDTGDKEMASAARFAVATFWVYLGLTAICALAYLGGGMTPFEAIAHALTTLSTGGYSTSDASFGHFESYYLQWAGTLFMLAGGLPFAWYIRVLRGDRVRSEQVRTLLTFLVAVILLLTFWLVLTDGMAPFRALTLVAFNVISVVTTTGFATTDYTTWGGFAIAVFVTLTIAGGCTGSTAGGAKTMRWIIFWLALRAYVQRIFMPHSLRAIRYEGRTVAPDVVDGVIVFFTLYVLTIAVLAVLLAFYGLDTDTAFSGALTAVTNVGPGVGTIIGPAGNFATLPEGAKWLLAFGMYVGRLELMTVFVLFTPAFWRAWA
ncbi:TrkH family potassium uptake protein [Pseudooceanicola nanhaiensis]|uniref:TrkH family potassium uptake protein n=1 Tax=Pseudooceanicola nanhaiensis TaxID=375761 RepID=UPI0035155B65